MSLLGYLLAALLPLLLAGFSRLRLGPWLVVSAALPGLLLAIFDPLVDSVRVDWLLLGIQLGLDQTGRLFLAASALVWLLAAVYATESLRDRANSMRFRVFFLLAMGGNFILILAQELTSFYLGFTLMGLSAYGLVAHRASVSARHAGGLYLTWTIFGEVVLFSALVLLAGQAGGTDFASLQAVSPPLLAVALLVLGFGIKLALPGLHLWLPHSYAAAPAAGAAVLSGPMISAGFLGWLRFLPPGPEVLVPWGELLIVLGLFGVVYGVAMGLMQINPKVVLGYSSISKMGLLSAGFGVALAEPLNAPLLLPALVFYTLQHLLVKSALFLGVDLYQRGQTNTWVMGGLILLVLALIGAPLTSGALAKTQLTEALPAGFSWFTTWLSLAGLVTTLLMGRLIFLLKARSNHAIIGRAALAAWLLLTGVILALPFILARAEVSFTGIAPVLSGLFASGLVWWYRPKMLTRLVGLIPPGDILIPVRKILRSLLRATQVPLNLIDKLPSPDLLPRVSGYARESSSPELPQASGQSGLSRWSGPLWLGLAGLVLLVLTFGF
jgi:formate hydrogenlyase subunit 3/multisubunit Na+/H+ antiporter MnhD subunit